MAKSWGNNVEESMFRRLEREENHEMKEVMDEQVGTYKPEVVIRSSNIYSILGAVYKILKKKDPELHDEVYEYVNKNMKKLSFDDLIKYLQKYVEFWTEDQFGSRDYIYDAMQIRNL